VIFGLTSLSYMILSIMKKTGGEKPDLTSSCINYSGPGHSSLLLLKYAMHTRSTES
jgi:hypothetical protein